jgi:hypothetical protein
MHLTSVARSIVDVVYAQPNSSVYGTAMTFLVVRPNRFDRDEWISMISHDIHGLRVSRLAF